MVFAHSIELPAAVESDEVLMLLVGQGNQSAFTTLVGRHLGRVSSMAWRVTGSQADGEEIAQEAFARVWVNAAKWRSPEEGGTARFTTWLYRVVMNLAIDRKRRPVAGALEAADEVVDERQDAQGDLQRRQVSTAVEAAVQALPERQRAALVLCFYEEMSNIEAAKVMDLSVGAVESLLIRAKKTLRQTLAGLKDRGEI